MRTIQIVGGQTTSPSPIKPAGARTTNTCGAAAVTCAPTLKMLNRRITRMESIVKVLPDLPVPCVRSVPFRSTLVVVRVGARGPPMTPLPPSLRCSLTVSLHSLASLCSTGMGGRSTRSKSFAAVERLEEMTNYRLSRLFL